jgi:hypothetical protein
VSRHWEDNKENFQQLFRGEQPAVNMKVRITLQQGSNSMDDTRDPLATWMSIRGMREHLGF